ncbi:MAG TPA: PDDEXK nuclease domain-containing protein [Phycisphaerae bacterium]|nr:PDDEXK nuclease domain-containing protein [Phycisphaerae bacterium]
MKPAKKKTTLVSSAYAGMLADVCRLLTGARTAAARQVNAAMTTGYWYIGRRIVEFEQAGKNRAAYGEGLLKRLARDLTKRYGRGFSADNLETMRRFYLCYSTPQNISETVSRKLPQEISETVSRKSAILLRPPQPGPVFPLSWSHYVLLVRRADSPDARAFYEREAMLGGWSVRQLDRQISTLFYERTSMSIHKGKLLRDGRRTRADERLTIEQAIKDPFVLEFLDLKDEYSESDLEEALIRQLETFLLELGNDFAFVGRQRRLRIGDDWYRIDLLFFHRRLKCLVVIDLKVGKFTHADAGQMHMYLNYASEHWTQPDENAPVGLILCARQNQAVARYSLDGLPNKVMAAEYRLLLPSERRLEEALRNGQKAFTRRPFVARRRKEP